MGAPAAEVAAGLGTEVGAAFWATLAGLAASEDREMAAGEACAAGADATDEELVVSAGLAGAPVVAVLAMLHEASTTPDRAMIGRKARRLRNRDGIGALPRVAGSAHRAGSNVLPALTPRSRDRFPVSSTPVLPPMGHRLGHRAA
jgi:hypothetical protein